MRADVFSYQFRDPRWLLKITLQALILAVPLVGWIATGAIRTTGHAPV